MKFPTRDMVETEHVPHSLCHVGRKWCVFYNRKCPDWAWLRCTKKGKPVIWVPRVENAEGKK